MSNLTGWLIATAYVLSIIGLAEGLRRWRGWGSELTRKVVHIGVGMLMWLVPFLFTRPEPFIATAAIFSVITLLDNRFHFFPSMASKDDESNLGTFYFPLVAGVVTWLFWEQPALMIAAMMPLAWGDGMAEIVGRRFGRNHYTVRGHTRSLEGSTAFLICGFITAYLALVLIPNPTPITPATALLPALVMTALATVVEAISIRGIDNITVTVVAVFVLSIWPF